MPRYWIAGLALAFAFCGSAEASPDWSEIGWLIGEWTADGGGGVGQGRGAFSFTPDAGGQVLVLHNFAEYPPQNGKPAYRHEDIMVVYREAGAMRAVYWDNEGHTIHYTVTLATADDVTLVSDDAAGPRYRLSYHRVSGGLEGRFEIAPDRDHFANLLNWAAHKSS